MQSKKEVKYFNNELRENFDKISKNLDLEYLNDAFSILDPETKNDNIKTDIENISQNLYVQCAEVAINVMKIQL